MPPDPAEPFAALQAVPHAAWYVVHTKPRLEAEAQKQLLRQEFDIYLPLFRVYRKPRKARAAVGPGAGLRQAPAPAGLNGGRAPGAESDLVTREPMFPRYLFLRPTRATQSLGTVRSTLGVSRLVMFGLQPAVLADELVQAIRQAEALREQAGLSEISPFQPGMPVILQDSPLAGAQALVHAVSRDRVTLLLNILGRPQTVQVAFAQIAPL